jgi:hypothetical protein
MRNETASYIGPGHADSGTEHSVLDQHEAEAQHHQSGRSGKA